MRQSLLFIIAAVFFHLISGAQTAKNAAVELWANVQSAPPTVTLNWVAVPTTTNYAVARKLKNSGTWTTLAATIPGTVNQFVDNTVSAGVSYEYRVFRSGVTGTVNFNGFGYINTGIEIPAVENRGRLILLVANTLSTSLAPEIARLQDDLEGDGWEVSTIYGSTTASVTQIKAQIVSEYNVNPSNTKALFILGRIPVPYSGNINPDAHPDHLGAWPADVYYGDMNGTWTDVSVSSPTANPARIVNVPGDGKFDQSTLPSDVELQVGRVDLSGMTSFSLTQTQLLKNYLDKDHDYRKKNFAVIKRAVIDDNFGYFNGEAFASNGWKNFAPICTPSNVIAGDYLTTLNANNYQWSYGCGGGSFTSAGGIGNTTDFTTSNTQNVFTILFGSYFGDWDINNNFLRAPLCQGKTLTSLWAGRPHWALHHMGLGETIGYSTLTSQNNNGTYFYAYGGGDVNFNPPRVVHVALMGDPTLRNDIVSPVSNVVATRVGNNCHITWSASTQTNVLGYNIYMKNDTNKTYVKINPSLITGTSYTHQCLIYPGIYKYMVRAMVLEQTPSGSYYNMSEGIMDTALNNTNLTIYASAFAAVSPTSSAVSFTCQNIGGTSFNWSFGDGGTSTLQNPLHTYTLNGNYTATVVVSRACNSLTLTVPVGITTGIQATEAGAKFSVKPNPAQDEVYVVAQNAGSTVQEITILNVEGRELGKYRMEGDQLKISLNGYPKGVYILKADTDKRETLYKKLIVN